MKWYHIESERCAYRRKLGDTLVPAKGQTELQHLIPIRARLCSPKWKWKEKHGRWLLSLESTTGNSNLPLSSNINNIRATQEFVDQQIVKQKLLFQMTLQCRSECLSEQIPRKKFVWWTFPLLCWRNCVNARRIIWFLLQQESWKWDECTRFLCAQNQTFSLWGWVFLLSFVAFDIDMSPLHWHTPSRSVHGGSKVPWPFGPNPWCDVQSNKSFACLFHLGYWDLTWHITASNVPCRC